MPNNVKCLLTDATATALKCSNVGGGIIGADLAAELDSCAGRSSGSRDRSEVDDKHARVETV